MSKALRFVQITAKHQDFPFLTVFLIIKTSFQNISITLLRFCLNFTNIEAIVLEKNAPVNDFVRFPMPRIACVAGAWKLWAKERTGAREGDSRGVRERRYLSPRVSPSRAPVFSCALYFQAPAAQAMPRIIAEVKYIGNGVISLL